MNLTIPKWLFAVIGGVIGVLVCVLAAYHFLVAP